MQNTMLRMFMIAAIAMLPTLSAAADIPPVVETGTAPPAQAAPGTTQVIASESKPALKTAALPSTKIGYVDIVRLGSESEQGKALKSTLTAKKDQLQSKIEARKKQIEKLKTSIESQISTMTPQQRDAKSKEFQKKIEEFQKFAQKSEEEFIALQDKETRALYEEIEKSAVAHGTANGFSLIVVKKELLYIGSSVDAQDVTEALIKAMNESGRKK